MNDELRASYDANPYLYGAVLHSHPARMGAIARLLGRPAAPPDACRVLEIGCGIGGNLLPAAAQLTRSTFTGVDLSPAQIAIAERARAAAGIGNAKLHCADLRAFEPEPGGCDYIIAHGVYSWVPEDVRERLLALIATALAPDGIAYVSYNTQPGWGLLGGLREVLLAELAALPPGADRAAHLARLLPVLDRAFAAQPGAHAALMREHLAEMLAKAPALILHDELEPLCQPVTFLEFRARAAHHGLHFLSESHYASMPADHLGAQALAALAQLQPDPARMQQFLDLLGNRRFRGSLLTRTPVEWSRQPDTAAVRECALATHLRPDALQVDLTPGAVMQVSGRHGVKFAVRDAAQKAFLGALIAAAPERLPFPAALESAKSLLSRNGIPAALDEAVLAQAAARLFTVDQMDLLLTGGGTWLACDTAATQALHRHCESEGLPAANRWHEPLR